MSELRKKIALNFATVLFNGFSGAVSGLIIGGLFFDEPALGTVVGAVLSILFFASIHVMMKTNKSIPGIPIISNNDIDVESFKRFASYIDIKSLRAKEIEIIGTTNIKNSLILLQNGSLEINGLANIGKDFVCNGKGLINGPCIIKGDITGDNVIFKSSLKTNSINVRKFSVSGDLHTNNDVIASESIVLRFTTSTEIFVDGYLKAPEIILKAKTQKQIKDSLFKILRISKESPIVVRNMKLKGNILRLDGIRIENCDVEVENIEYLR